MPLPSNNNRVNKPNYPRPIRLHYRDICALLRVLDELTTPDSTGEFLELDAEETHAYLRLKEIKMAQEDYFTFIAKHDNPSNSGDTNRNKETNE